MDIDFDDLDAPNQGPSRQSRFAPKNSKFKPKPKPKTEQSNSDSIQPVKHESISDSMEIVKTEIEDVVAKIDIEFKLDPIEDPIEEDLIREDPMEVDHAGEEDDIVREIDVYFTPWVDVNAKLYVMQYPLKPCWRPYELDDQCEEVRVKSDTSEIEIDLAVDVDSKNYDSSSGVRMSKQVLASSGNLPCRSGYAVGVLVGNKLYLNPVNRAVQLRPTLKHLKDGDENKVVRKVKSENVEDLGEKDDWIRLKYNGSKSEASSRYLHNMMAEECDEIKFLMSSGEYVESFCPRMPNKQSGPSRSELLKLPLEDRLKTWICETGSVHPYNALKYLATGESEEDVLVLVKKLCCLVQGLWVPKSSLLKLEGVEALVRDYALYLFSKNHRINFNDIPKKMKLKSAMEDVLKVFAIRRPDLKDWKFKESRDVLFVQKHPDIVNEQDQAWEARGENLYIKIYGKDPPKMDMTTKVAPKSNANRNVPEASLQTRPVKTVISDKTREVVLKAIEKLLHTHKVCNFQRLGQLLRDTSLEAPPPPEHELREIIKEVAIDIHGVFVSKTSPDHSYDGLRRTVIDLLIVEGPNAKLRKAAIIEAGKIRLKRADIPTIEYNKVIQELCVSRGSVWMLKSGDDEFFFGLATAPAHVEDRLDDASLQFAEDNPSNKQQPVDSIMDYAASNGGSQQPPLGIVDVQDTTKRRNLLKISMEAKNNGFEKCIKEEGPHSAPKESCHNVVALHNVPHPEVKERLRFWSDPDTELKLAKDTGIHVFRTGIDWTRIMPEEPVNGLRKSIADWLLTVCQSVRYGVFNKTMNNMDVAHAKAYDYIHQHSNGLSRSKDGVAHHVSFLRPYGLFDISIAKSLTLFRYLDSLCNKLDYIGINYYGQEMVARTGLKLAEAVEYGESGRRVYPDGLFRVLLHFHERYKHLNVSFIITEIGVADGTDLIRRPYM